MTIQNFVIVLLEPSWSRRRNNRSLCLGSGARERDDGTKNDDCISVPTSPETYRPFSSSSFLIMIVRLAAGRIPTAAGRASAALRNGTVQSIALTGRGSRESCSFATFHHFDGASRASVGPRAEVAAAQPELALAYDYVDENDGDDENSGHDYCQAAVSTIKTPGSRPSSSPYPPPPPPQMPPTTPSSVRTTGGGGGGGPGGGGNGRHRCPKVRMDDAKQEN